jgi:hypothetical protein
MIGPLLAGLAHAEPSAASGRVKLNVMPPSSFALLHSTFAFEHPAHK